ncbi:Uncharacterised protein [Chlamydia abortus]|nr:Uncharacterised protein [Chlamydia abortus]
MSTLSPNAALSLLLTPWTSPRRGTSVFPWSVWIFRVSLSGTQNGLSSFCGKTQIAPLDLIKIGSGPYHLLSRTFFHLTISLGLSGSEQ